MMEGELYARPLKFNKLNKKSISIPNDTLNTINI